MPFDEPACKILHPLDLFFLEILKLRNNKFQCKFRNFHLALVTSPTENRNIKHHSTPNSGKSSKKSIWYRDTQKIQLFNSQIKLDIGLKSTAYPRNFPSPWTTSPQQSTPFPGRRTHSILRIDVVYKESSSKKRTPEAPTNDSGVKG